MRYYTAQQTLELLNKELPHNPLPYDLAQLADLCRRDTITPVFYYQRYAHHIEAETFEPLPQPHLFKCYLTSTDLLMLINSQTAKVSINRATIYEAHNSTHLQADDEVLLTENNFHYCFEVLNDSDFYNTFFTIPDSPYSVTLNDLLFPSEQVQRYIAWHDFADVSTPEQQRIAELESELADLKQKLNQKADHTVSGVLTAIHDKNHEHHAPDLSHSIKLWSDLYINGKIGSDSHSNKADIWINNNTGYADNAKSSVGRIREIATPLKDFGAKRSKEIKK